MAQYGLFVLKVPLNLNQPTNLLLCIMGDIVRNLSQCASFCTDNRKFMCERMCVCCVTTGLFVCHMCDGIESKLHWKCVVFVHQ